MGVAYTLSHMHELQTYPYEAAQCDGEYVFVILCLGINVKTICRPRWL